MPAKDNEIMTKLTTIHIIYDGQCPFCRNYIHLLKLRDIVDEVILTDARTPSAILSEAQGHGLNIDDGMIVKIDNIFYFGAEAMHTLSLLSTKSDFFNRTSFFFLRSKGLTALLYPLFKAARMITLWALHIPRITTNTKNK